MENNKELETKLISKMDRVSELLETLLIVQCGIVEINKQEIRKIAGVGMDRVTKITKLIKKPKTPKV